MEIGDTVRNRRTGHTGIIDHYWCGKPVMITSGGTEIVCNMDDIECVTNDELPNCVWKHADTPFAKNH